MDREVLRKQAAARRNLVGAEEQPAKKKVEWLCEYCQHPFQSERVFMNHRCKERARIDELRSATGQAAYSYYSEWMRLNRRSVPPIETFASSSYYSTFIRFAEWVKRTHLPDPLRFVKTMVEHGNVQPSLWCRDNVYAMFLQGYDGIVPPEEQFIKSIDEILALITELNVEPRRIFDAIGVKTLLELVHKRKISPWFLVASSAFRKWWQTLPPDDASRIEDTLQVGALMIRISHSEKMKKLLTEFTKATEEIGL